MYCNFFGFTEKPFDVTPDPKFLYLSSGHRESLASLIYGIRERRGFMTVVGEVGTGKTTLLNAVLDQLDQKVRVAFIFNTCITFNEMLTLALRDLKLVGPEETVSKVEALSRLKGFAIHELSRAGNVVLIVDEAQNLEPSAMENVRLLSNLETRKHKLIQIVLCGQPELDVKLSQPELRQLSQRISMRRYITPLCEEETYEYIQHRLNVANYSGPALFDRGAQQLIWEYCGGVPRKINLLCDNALLIGYALRQKTIETTVIEEVIKDLSWSPFVSVKEPQATASVQASPQQEKTSYVSVKEPQAMGSVQASPQVQEKTSYSRFATAAISVVASCAMFLAFLLGFVASSGSWPSLEISRPIPLLLKMWAEVSGQEDPLRGSDNAVAKIENREPSPSEVGESPIREAPVVTVKKGDNLFWIITDAYGRYDMGLLGAVLQENPQILNPDQIMVDQVIKLPERKSPRGMVMGRTHEALE